MKKLSARRRHPLAALVVLLIALAATGGLYATFAPTGKAQADETSAQSLAVEEGQKLFRVGCASCHGTGGQGSSDGPSLVGAGAAAVDFQVSTGRMPLQQQGVQAPKKPAVYNQKEIDQLAAYVASLGPGPAVPEESQYDPAGGNVARGGDLFRNNCAQCHNFTGKGGALTDGKSAPNIDGVDPKHMYEAMVTGPQAMPVYPDRLLTPENKQDIIAFLDEVGGDEAESPGGFSLGGLGPVSEGLFAWVFGLGALVVLTIWITARSAKARKS